jgi:integrase
MAAVRPLTTEEVKKMLQTRAFHTMGNYSRNCAILVMQTTMGPRIHELLRLTVGDVVDRNGTLRESVYFRKTKNSAPRRVYMPSALPPYLIAWLRELEKKGMLISEIPLFVGAYSVKAISRQQVYKIYAAARRELAIEGIGTHSPRKTWAAACYNILSDERANGARVEPLIELQRLGGWKKVDSVIHYLNSVSHWGRFVQSRIFGELK